MTSINTNKEKVSPYQKAKKYRAARLTLKGYIRDFFLISIAVFSAAFGLKGFLLTNQFIDGGATGVSLLISALSDIPLYVLIICINIPFIIMGYKTLGKNFAIKTILAIIGLALVIANISFPNVTDDNLLVALFGGFFLGAGIGFAIRGGAVIDGTEVLAIWLSR
ncbi:MAG TPA: YitT family protein, partial [Chitinophagaceae bacterium]|nr:YitT family protein [Chitinophagaceae bacterium]